MSQLVSNWTSAQGFMMSNYFMMSVNEILSFTFKTLLYASMSLKQESRIFFKHYFKTACKFESRKMYYCDFIISYHIEAKLHET